MSRSITHSICRISIALGFLSFACPNTPAQRNTRETINALRFEEPFLSNGQPFSDVLTSNEVLAVHQDKEGFIWIATRYGFNRYDGYQIKDYKYPQFQIPNYSIQCLTDDYAHNLWLGTSDGLLKLNKTTGNFQSIPIPGAANRNIASLLVTRNGTVWIGTGGGLFLYSPSTNSFQLCDTEFSQGVIGSASICSLIEDSQGDVWIGTWNQGLYRYSFQEKRFFAYPPMNEYHSAHVLFEDHHQNIWMGTWKGGLYLLKNPKDMKRVSWECFRHSENDPNSLSANIIYSLSSDPFTNTLWVGTRTGLSILELSSKKQFINYHINNPRHYLPYEEISSLLYSQQNTMWIGSIGGGLYEVNTQPPLFSLVQPKFSQNYVSAKSIRKILIDSKEWVWLALSGYGIARCKSDGSQPQAWKDIPEFSHIDYLGAISSVIERKKNGEIWIGTLRNGEILIYSEGQKVRSRYLRDFSIPESLLSSLLEDSQQNCWIGTSRGVYVLYNHGNTFAPTLPPEEKIKLSECNILTLFEDREGAIWMGTKENGIIRIQGNIYQPTHLKFTTYNSLNQRFPNVPINSIYQDRNGRIWIGTKGNGIFLYDSQHDTFKAVPDKYRITTDVVSNIEGDENGDLWISTNKGLVKFSYIENGEPLVRMYSTANGLQNSYPSPGTSFRANGKLYFGGTNGFCVFNPHEIQDIPMKAPLAITDIKFLNTSIEQLDSTLQKRISAKAPEFTKRLTIPYQYNNFSIEFAALAYNKPQFIHYAFMLNGFDKDWQYVDGAQRYAHYNNLPSGNYTFRLKAANANGIWSGEVKEIEITILPPFYATWWAYLLYILLFLTISYFTYRTIRNRIRLKNQLRLNLLEQAKAEEINHAKLQFFTNLTHELMTPLSILSASIDELRIQIPEYKNTYRIMTRNVNRLIRLLQQILEFRKAESGNLKLRVSKHDIIAFLHNEVEAFRPLVKKRNLDLSVKTSVDALEGYFDPDKLDKILYNLLSNASKYNRENGFIRVNLTYNEASQSIEISVADNGIGISSEDQKNLFTRFYEGDYRRFNTIGTGIGLSLTQDLVTLHNGSIWVESERNKGATFFVNLPIGKEAFDSSQIDEEIPDFIQGIILPSGASSPPNNKDEEEELGDEYETDMEQKPYSLLIVEDNEELLSLMVKLLQNEYQILTATNGEEAMNTVEKEEVDLIVSDFMMPVMDGLSLCKALKKNINYSHIPFIILTAKSREEDRAEAYHEGVDGYICKPFNLTVLHAKIKNLLRKKEQNATDFRRQVVFEIKDLNYNAVDENFLQRAIECIHKHIEDPELDMQQLANELQTSKTNLYRKLKSLTGLPPVSFIRNIRMKAACKLMNEKKHLRINEIAYAVGFKDAKYFSTCFRKEFGMQPKEFINHFTEFSSDKGNRKEE